MKRMVQLLSGALLALMLVPGADALAQDREEIKARILAEIQERMERQMEELRRDIDKMLSLGYGAHHCLGAAAARLQGRVALARMLERFPDFEVDAAAGRFAPGGFVRRYESLPFTA